MAQAPRTRSSPPSRRAKRSCALMMLDLDRFKQVNDTLRPPGGRRAAQAGRPAARADRSTRACEIGRLGGDEFQIIVPDVDDRGKLGEIGASGSSRWSRSPTRSRAARAMIGTSIGIAIAPYDGINQRRTGQERRPRASMPPRAAGAGSSGSIRASCKDGAGAPRDRGRPARRARPAASCSMHYQPIVRASDNMVAGFEALMRWNHPERGQIRPTVFIPIAEETSLINADRRMGAAHRRAKMRRMARATLRVCGQRLGAAVLVRRAAAIWSLARSPQSGPQARAARARDHRERVHVGDADAGRRDVRRAPEASACGSRSTISGPATSSLSYLRKRAVRQDQDRPELRARLHRAGQPNLGDHHRDRQPRRRAGDGDHRRGRRGDGRAWRWSAKRGATSVQGFIYSRAVAGEEVLAELGSGRAGVRAGRAGQAPLRAALAVPQHRGDPRGPPLRRDAARPVAERRDDRGAARRSGRAPSWCSISARGSSPWRACGARRTRRRALEFEQPLVSDGARRARAPATASRPTRSPPPACRCARCRRAHYPLPRTAANAPMLTTPRFMQVERDGGRAAPPGLADSADVAAKGARMTELSPHPQLLHHRAYRPWQVAPWPTG